MWLVKSSAKGMDNSLNIFQDEINCNRKFIALLHYIPKGWLINPFL